MFHATTGVGTIKEPSLLKEAISAKHSLIGLNLQPYTSNGKVPIGQVLYNVQTNLSAKNGQLQKIYL
jgi:hypothetical protein